MKMSLVRLVLVIMLSCFVYNRRHRIFRLIVALAGLGYFILSQSDQIKENLWSLFLKNRGRETEIG
ncbi:hypothetical protein [Scopulibacillus cellulosilyticus]|uniref:Uncharacterized protein n=1 Tax=Scopulibacillus cellulosilyticus TaxID=2665665 RepID=A0ABW2PW51_9BACL